MRSSNNPTICRLHRFTPSPTSAHSSAPAGFTAKCKTEYKYSYNLRGRIGYASGSWLFYGMGGVVRARTDNSVVYSFDTGADIIRMGEKQIANPNGYLFGVGLEYQDARGMRWGLSYTHIKLEDVTLTFRDPLGGGSTNRFNNDPDVLGAALRIPLQQQATQAADPGPPAAQAPAVAQAQVPAAARPAAPAASPATAPSTAPAARAAPPPRAPVQGTPTEPDEPAPTGRPKK